MDREHRRYARKYVGWVDTLNEQANLADDPQNRDDAHRLLAIHGKAAEKVRKKLYEYLGCDDLETSDAADNQISVKEIRVRLREALQAKLTLAKGEYEGISMMNEAELESRETGGKINAKGLSNFIFGMRIPTPNGYKLLRPSKADMKQSITLPTVTMYEITHEDHDAILVEIPFSIRTNTGIPLPADYEVVAIEDSDENMEDEHFVLKPQTSEQLPLTFNLDTPYLPGVLALIRKSEGKSYIRDHYLPTAEEQAFWSAVLPVPDDLVQEYRKGSSEKFMLGLQEFFAREFRYICNDRLGELIEKYKEELPLIANALKMGHCDLLAWTMAGYLRGLGIPAFTTSEHVVVDAPDGTSAFNSACGHARVGIFNEKGGIDYFDPTTDTKVVRASDNLVNKLSLALAKSITDEDKEKAILNFRESVLGGHDVNLVIEAARELGEFEDSTDNETLGSIFGSDNRSRLQALTEMEIAYSGELKSALQKVLAYCRKCGLRYHMVSDFSLEDRNECARYAIANGTIATDDPRLDVLRDARKADVPNAQDIIFGVPENYRGKLDTFVPSEFGHYLVLDRSNISFSEGFKVFVRTVILPRVGISSSYEVDVGKENIVAYEIEMFYLIQLALQSDTKPEFLHILKHDLNLSDEEIQRIKSIVAPVADKKAVITDIFDWLKQGGELDATANVLQVSQKELGVAVSKMSVLLNHVLATRATAPNSHEWHLEEYSPEKHTPRDIHWKTTARLGKPIAKTVEQFAERKEVLYVVCDSQDYWQYLVLLQAINSVQGKRNLDVVLQVPRMSYKGVPAYISLRSEKRLSLQQFQLLAKRLAFVSRQGDGSRENFHLPYAKQKIKMLCISDRTGDIASLKSQLRGKCDFTGVTWKQTGTMVYPRVKDQ